MESRVEGLNNISETFGFLIVYVITTTLLFKAFTQATCFDYLCHLSHKMLCTLWDPIVFTYTEYIKLNHLSQRV